MISSQGRGTDLPGEVSGSGLPSIQGQLLSGATCDPCQSLPTPGFPGAQPTSCPPPPPGGPCWGTSNGVPHSGGTGASGNNPVVLEYGPDLSVLPAGTRILGATAHYLLTGGVGAVITDNGGSGFGSFGNIVSIDWGPKAVAGLNGYLDGSAPVKAVGAFSTGGGGFQVDGFQVNYEVCPDPRTPP